MLRNASAAVLILFISAWAAPLRAAPCGPTLRSGEIVDRKLASDINTLGFEAFSRAGDASGFQDAVVSPFTIWYLDQFLDSNWGKGGNAPATLLHQLTKSFDFSATVWANKNMSTYTVNDAAVARRTLCASTRWFPWAPVQRAPNFINPHAYDFSVTLSFKVDFTLPATGRGSLMRVPFFDDGSLRGVRLDSKDGATAAYLLWGPDNVLTSFRESMNAAEWESLTSRFKETNVLLDDISLRRSAYSEWLPGSLYSFGTAVSPGLSLPRALLSNEILVLNAGRSNVTVVGALHGHSTKPTIIRVNGRTQYQITDYSVISDRGGTLPRSQRLSVLNSLIYVIENRSTGAILLIGAHE